MGNTLTWEQFEIERDLLIEAKGFRIPTKAFCDTFMDRLPNDVELYAAGYYDDDSDYHAWGQALFDDIDKSGEYETNLINIWDCADVYEKLDDEEDPICNNELYDIITGLNPSNEEEND